MQIILASTSPRRKELLSKMGVRFDVVHSDFDEYLDDNRSPEEVAKELGLGKAMAVARRYPEALVIGADTIVTIKGRQLAKADDISHAREMLLAVTKHPNKLTSSIVVVCLSRKIQITEAENAWIYFKPYDEQAVEDYLSTGDYKDKAGAYGVQSGAAPLIESVKGNMDTIMGLPTHLLAPILRKLSIDAIPVEISLQLYGLKEV